MIMHSGRQADTLTSHMTNQDEPSRGVLSSRQFFTGTAVRVAAGALAAAGIALWLLSSTLVRAQNLGSPAFANPSEVRSRANEKRLRGVMQLSSRTYTIPNVGSSTLRQFRGWDASQPAPNPANDTAISPGPTLRARLGDLVEISFLNQIDDSQFPYSFVTDSPPGVSDFGCDKSGTRDPGTGFVLPYPATDEFPNCFHGSSTANLHFHGTHTSPDGLGDNVLVQVLPQSRPDSSTFDRLFDAGTIPQKWADMPAAYRAQQMALIKAYDTDASAAAAKNKLRPPDSLYEADRKAIDAGQWPQYLMGAFPNFFPIPDYSSGNYQAGQAPGTQWYHAHKHGSTSLHMRNGLAGAFIIESSQEGGYDHVIRRFYGWGDAYGAHEKIFVIQQFDPTLNQARSPRGAKGPVNAGKGTAQIHVNGLLTPTINMQPGEVQLWRFINATEGNLGGVIASSLFQTAGFTFKQTAQDGVQFSPASYKDQPFLNANAPNGLVPGGLTLAGGNRADLLVQAPMATGVVAFESGAKTLFFVNVAGVAATLPNGAFPTTWAEMPKFLNDLPRPGPNDAVNQNSPVKFQWEDGRTKPGLNPANPQGFAPHFMINGKQFGQTGNVIDQCMPLDGLQDWVLENYTAGVAHPFHIHINPFQVLRIDTPTGRDQYNQYRPVSDLVWQDTIAIPPAVITTNAAGQITNVTPGRVTIRQTYRDFTGTFVLHCHILAHEDRGMMQLVRVVPTDSYPQACQNNIPVHH
jgi:FtsP/CotA-like multicopper oxidase with cupredoxin domain